MIPLTLAIQLKEAGLKWLPDINDFFAIPDSDLDDRIFVMSDMMTEPTTLKGWPAITFHGTSEWAMDYIFIEEVVWMPTEEQLRQELVFLLDQSGGKTELMLKMEENGRYTTLISFQNTPLTFTAPTALETYAHPLLHILENRKPSIDIHSRFTATIRYFSTICVRNTKPAAAKPLKKDTSRQL